MCELAAFEVIPVLSGIYAILALMGLLLADSFLAYADLPP
jgi:hypothetical protein